MAVISGDAGDLVGDVGEFGLIDRVTARLRLPPGVLLGPGDDAAVVAAPDGRVVATTDLLVDGRHFDRSWSSAYDVGRRAAAANLADVVAMGARPTALLVGLAAPATLPVRWAEDLAGGLDDECALVGAGVAGGDVVASDRLTIAVTALGDLEGRTPVTRSGARAGDAVVLAGRLGLAAAGLDLLRAGRAAGYDDLAAAHRRPEVPYAAGLLLARAGATAMTDVSDGLLADLGHVAHASTVDVELTAADLPCPDRLTAAAADLGVDPLVWVASGGDDHALVATLPAGDVVAVALALSELVGPVPFTQIGRVVDVAAGQPPTVRFVDRGTPAEPGWAAGRGHEHFRGPSPGGAT